MPTWIQNGVHNSKQDNLKLALTAAWTSPCCPKQKPNQTKVHNTGEKGIEEQPCSFAPETG